MRIASLFVRAVLLLSLPQVACKKTQPAQSDVSATARTIPRPPATAHQETSAPANSFAGGVHFIGEVKRGDTFAKSLAPNMIFRLEPDAGEDSGWSIRIAPGYDSAAASIDCIGAVSEPLHGDKNLLIEPPEDGSPGKLVHWDPHEFDFVPDAANCKAAWELANFVNYPSNLPDKEREVAEVKLGRIPKSRGKLTIVASRVGPQTPNNEHGVIEWLKFDVVLSLPSAMSQVPVNENE